MMQEEEGERLHCLVPAGRRARVGLEAYVSQLVWTGAIDVGQNLDGHGLERDDVGAAFRDELGEVAAWITTAAGKC